MIPYPDLMTIALGPFTLYVWGLFVAAGFLVAAIIARQRAGAVVYDLAFWVIIAAFIGARLSHVFLYDFDYYRAHPNEIIMFWRGGLSSLGGFVGGTIVALFFIVRRKLSVRRIGDAVFLGLPLGFAIGRFGCYLTHMHPGIPSDAWYAVRYSDTPRLDLGLIESVAMLVFGTLLALLARRKRPDGFFLTLGAAGYSFIRFWLDFLRVEDARYLSLTPAQWASAAVFLIALAYLLRRLIGYRHIRGGVA